jgi:hypothetical protein
MNVASRTRLAFGHLVYSALPALLLWGAVFSLALSQSKSQALLRSLPGILL